MGWERRVRIRDREPVGVALIAACWFRRRRSCRLTLRASIFARSPARREPEHDRLRPPPKAPMLDCRSPALGKHEFLKEVS